jgi:hypothetical protein
MSATSRGYTPRDRDQRRLQTGDIPRRALPTHPRREPWPEERVISSLLAHLSYRIIDVAI